MSDKFVTLDQVNTIEFDSTHLWSISLEDAPSPFNEWFPAVSFDCDVYSIRSQSYDIGNIQFQFPVGLTSLTCRIECYDAEDGRLYKYLKDWTVNTLYKSSPNNTYQKGMNYLDECCKTLKVRKYNYKHEIVREDSYIVSPEGSFKDTGTADAQEKILSFELRIQNAFSSETKYNI